jgi:mono/diheme cytochrome c family protein
MRAHQFAAAIFAVMLANILTVSAPALARSQMTGALEFKSSCAACHGAEGRGDGPMAEVLTVKPTDLTRLARRNNGKFSKDEVTAVIDGRTAVKGHGTRAMPVWGAVFEMDVAREYGPYGSEWVVKSRIAQLVRYLETIQQK